MKYHHRRQRQRRSILASVPIVLLLATYVGWALLRPLTALQPESTTKTLSFSTPEETLAWPQNTQSAVGIVGTKVQETYSEQKPVPTASTAKIITALLVLKKHPLKAKEQGPVITINASDVARYVTYVSQEGSVVPVQLGEQISEYQMLQAIMLPSANNIADSLAIWAYGSLANYTTAANAYLAEHALTQTHVGSDASGLSPDTVSSARDLVQLGILAMQDPVLAEIVGQKTATNIPVIGTISNVNYLIGTDNIIGLKTGNSDQAGGVFVSASRIAQDKQPVTIVTAVTGAPDLASALQLSLELVQSTQKNFTTTRLIKKGTVVGQYKQPWGGRISVSAPKDITVTDWRGSTITARVTLGPSSAKASAERHPIGSIAIPSSLSKTTQTIPLTLDASPQKPPIQWRLLHPIDMMP